MTTDQILITVRLQSRKRCDETRKCFWPKDMTHFNGLVEKLEKLFSCKICQDSCIYLDTNGDHICFSSDEELAVAFHLLKGSCLRMEVSEMAPQILKEDNPSEISTDCSMNSSLSQHGGTPSSSSSTEKEGEITPKSSLFRTFILPKISKQFENSPARRKSTTRTTKSAHMITAHVVQEKAKNVDHAMPFEMTNLDNPTDLALYKSAQRKDLGDSVRASSDEYTFSDQIRALLRIIVWLGNKLA